MLKYAKKPIFPRLRRAVKPEIARRRAALVLLAARARRNGLPAWPKRGGVNLMRLALIEQRFPPISRRQVARELDFCLGSGKTAQNRTESDPAVSFFWVC